MDELIKSLNFQPNGTEIIIEWSSKCKIKGKIDTIYETDNGLEPDSIQFKEFFACSILVIKIIKNSEKRIKFNVGDIIEISSQNAPLRIQLNDGFQVWSKM